MNSQQLSQRYFSLKWLNWNIHIDQDTGRSWPVSSHTWHTAQGEIWKGDQELSGEEQVQSHPVALWQPVLASFTGAFFHLLCLLCDYMCEQPEVMSSHRLKKRLKFFISRKWQERESSEGSSQRLWEVKYRWVNSPHVDTSQQQNASAR